MDALPSYMKLDLRHFVSLTYVARFGSFTEAATQLGYTQSAVSQHVQRLESLIGSQLLERSAGGKSVTLTPAGRLLLQHAETITGAMQRVAVDAGALSRGAAGILRVGCFESVGSSLLAPILAKLRDVLPKAQVVLTELPDDGDLLQLVESDQLDLTFVVFPMPDGPFATETLIEDPYVLAVSKQSPLAREDGPVNLDDYPDLPLMSYAHLRTPHTLEARSGRPGYRSRVVFRSNHNATLLDLAAHGYAAAVVSQLAVLPERADVHARRLSGIHPRVIGVGWHSRRTLSVMAQAFIDAAKDETQGYGFAASIGAPTGRNSAANSPATDGGPPPAR
ncbi:ModE molybdate transport repressor domain-containing protein [Saccharopolyspora shandongensis]|uniref:ModE molybdate transport repressor domain-containing protein n=1 Tax=Saccharopolyspora shandongensis TaxID=418495 RepID=A0A1H3Q1M3_9PSEU|nr:LysR family transcriptional regulator [Saccharopolyspora shandongensis]SDZ07028.1 ModE molybdate transport repressor domain-containing protein [Saccharopolyspora shandongensis]